jgi:hypothetical protein
MRYSRFLSRIGRARRRVLLGGRSWRRGYRRRRR